MPNDDPPVSTVEDLDPDPAPRKDRVEVRELLVGLLLLIAVGGWAVLQAAQNSGPEGHFRLGRQAETEGKWSEALSHYSAASDYPGAADGVTRVTRTINGLQEHVVSARWYAQEGQWASALLSVQSARTIDPNFGVLASIEAEAKSHVYSQAVRGAVAMREVDGSRALYYRSATGWVRLPDSDGLSRVIASESGGRFLYDVPVEWSTPDSVSPPPEGRLRSLPERLKYRRLEAALFDDAEPRHYTLNFDTDLYNSYRIGLRGVWGMPGGRSVRGDQAEMFMGEWPLGEPVGYGAFDSPAAMTMNLPGPDWVALEVEAGAGRLLLADLTGGVVHLHVSEADGSNPRPLYSLIGRLGMFVISPDGRYLVMREHTPVNEHLEKQSAVLLDLQGAAPPRVLAEVEVPGRPTSVSPWWLMVGFLSEGDLGGKVLVTRWRADATTVSVFDPDHPQEPQVTGTIPGAPALVMQVIEVPSAHENPWPLVMWAKEDLGDQPASTGEVVAARFAPGKAAVTRTLSLQAENDVLLNAVRGDYMIWVARKRAVNVDGTKSAVQPVNFYSLPLDGLDDPRPQPTGFYSRILPPLTGGGPYYTLDSSVNLGPEMLAYIEGTDLRARTYDGAVDVLLESGVLQFEGNDWYSRWPWP